MVKQKCYPLHLCYHCNNNVDSVCIIDEVSITIDDTPFEEYGTLVCENFSKREFPYCPYCGTPFTLVNEIIDPDDDGGNYLKDNFGSAGLIGFTCLECGETILVEDIK